MELSFPTGSNSIGRAIAAGNTVVLKPSEFAPHTARVIQSIIEVVFDEDHVAVVQGDASTATTLLKKNGITSCLPVAPPSEKSSLKLLLNTSPQRPWNWAEKVPASLMKQHPLVSRPKRLVWGKILNCGQTCIAPDYLLVNEKVKDELTQELILQIQKAFGENQQNSSDYGRIAHQNHFNKLKTSLENQNVIYGGQTDKKDLFFGPTLVDNPPLDSELMQEEIFGPILPIISYHKDEDIHEVLQKSGASVGFLCLF